MAKVIIRNKEDYVPHIEAVIEAYLNSGLSYADMSKVMKLNTDIITYILRQFRKMISRDSHYNREGRIEEWDIVAKKWNIRNPEDFDRIRDEKTDMRLSHHVYFNNYKNYINEEFMVRAKYYCEGIKTHGNLISFRDKKYLREQLEIGLEFNPKRLFSTRDGEDSGIWKESDIVKNPKAVKVKKSFLKDMTRRLARKNKDIFEDVDRNRKYELSGLHGIPKNIKFIIIAGDSVHLFDEMMKWKNYRRHIGFFDEYFKIYNGGK